MTTLIRRRCYDEVGLYDEGLPVEDWDMWLRISQRFEFHFSPKISARYRILASSMIRSKPHLLLDSLGEVARKFLLSGTLNPACEALAVDMLSSYAKTLYRRGDPRSVTHSRLALKYRWSPQLAMVYLLGRCGIPASLVLKPYDTLRLPRR
jgi:hypothetical protein